MRHQEEDNSNDNVQNKKVDEYIHLLLKEKSAMIDKDCPFAQRFIDEEIGRARENLIKGPPRDIRYIELFNERPIKLTVKVLLPTKKYPGINFVGKLLGPKGSNLKQLQEKTRCFMNLNGRGSMRDREKEEEFRRSCEPKYAHLTEELHVQISALAPPAEAHSRISNALNEVRKHFMLDLNPGGEEEEEEQEEPYEEGIADWRRGPPQDERRPPNFRGRGMARGFPRPHNPPKSSVMSILNKARIAMAESYSFQQPRRYQEENYGNNSYDANFKKRKF